MFHIHRAERADGLVDALGGVLSAPLADPLQAEVVAVPTRGVERWLTQRLSRRARRLAGPRLTASAPTSSSRSRVGWSAGRSRRPPASTGTRIRGCRSGSVWPLLDVVDEHPRRAVAARRWRPTSAAAKPTPMLGGAHAGSAACATSPTSTTATRSTGRRCSAAWAGSDAPTADALAGRAVAAPARADRRAEPGRAAGDACARLRAEPALVDLPARLSLFGLTRLPASYLDVLRRARRRARRPPLPPPPLGRAVGADRVATADPPPIVRRADDPTAELPRNPLLASWGRDAREMQLVLAARPGDAVDHDHLVVERAATTLLAGSRPTCAPTARRPARPCPARRRADAARPRDRSLQVHACHGRARQVEVVRDAILHLLADDPTLEPRDIVVMCPDIEAFAPLIHATFGAGDGRRRTRTTPRRAGATPHRPARAPRRPLAAPDQPGARRRRRSCSTSPTAG